MSQTQSTFKDVSTDESNGQIIDLAAIVAEQTSTVAALPDWDVYTTACDCALSAVERAIEHEGH